MQQVVIAASLTDRNEQYERARRLGLDTAKMPVPSRYTGSIDQPCEECRVSIAVGPMSQEKVKEETEAGRSVAVVCIFCAVELASRSKTVEAHHLNNREFG